ncbi:MAG: cell division protein FtsQ/DivIB [Acidimicrobiia bacterium]
MSTIDTDTGIPPGPDVPRGPDGADEADRAPDGPFVVEDADALDVFDDIVDPRMRQRWVAARRAEGRRRLRILLGVVAFASVAVIAYVIAHSSVLGVDRVTVTGNGTVPIDRIRAAARIQDGAPLLFLDTGAVTRRLERLPTIAHAEVSTELPSTVSIRVTERVPIAWARAAGADPVAVLDADGRVISRVATPPPGLMRVTGVSPGAAGTRAPRSDAIRALAALPVRLRAMGERFGVTKAGPVLVLVTNPVAEQVRFGDASDIRQKSVAALAVIDSLATQGRHVKVVGVDVPGAPWTG